MKYQLLTLIPLLAAALLLLSGCEEVLNPKADVTIENATKNDEGGGNWSVDVIYDIENTGLHDISYWEVWFKVTTVGGETIEDSDFGYDLPVGDKVNDRAFNIDTLGYEPDSMPQSIEVSKKELESD